MADGFKVEVSIADETKKNPDRGIQAMAEKLAATAEKLAETLTENGIRPIGERKGGTTYASPIRVEVQTFPTKDGEIGKSPQLTVHHGKELVEGRANFRGELTAVFVKQFDEKQGTYVATDKSNVSKITADIATIFENSMEQAKEANKSAEKQPSEKKPAEKKPEKEASGIRIQTFKENDVDKALSFVDEDKRSLAADTINKVAEKTAKKLANDLDAHGIVPKTFTKDGKEYNAPIKVTVQTFRDENKNNEQFFYPKMTIDNGKDRLDISLKRVETEQTFDDKETGDTKNVNAHIMTKVTIKQYDEAQKKYVPADMETLSAGTAEIANHIANSIELSNISYEANTGELSHSDTHLSKDEKVVHDAFSKVEMNDTAFAQALIDNGFANDNVKESGLDSVQFRSEIDKKQVVYVGKTPDNELVAVAVNYNQREDGKYVSKMIQSADDLSFIKDPNVAQYIGDKVLDGDKVNEKVKEDIER